MYSPLGTPVLAKVGLKGQVVIPKAFRDRLGMKPGASVFIDVNDDGLLMIEFAWNDVAGMFDYFARFPVQPGMEGKTALDILHEMNREDEEAWERKYGWPPFSTPSTPTQSSEPSARKPSGRSSRRPPRPRSRSESPSG